MGPKNPYIFFLGSPEMQGCGHFLSRPILKAMIVVSKLEGQYNLFPQTKSMLSSRMPYYGPETPKGVSKFLASLDHSGRIIVLGHILNTQTLTKTDEQKKGFK